MTTQSTKALQENTDKQLTFLSLDIILQIFKDELPEGKDPNRTLAIQEMILALKMRLTNLQHEAKALEEARHETSH